MVEEMVRMTQREVLDVSSSRHTRSELRELKLLEKGRARKLRRESLGRRPT